MYRMFIYVYIDTLASTKLHRCSKHQVQHPHRQEPQEGRRIPGQGAVLGFNLLTAHGSHLFWHKWGGLGGLCNFLFSFFGLLAVLRRLRTMRTWRNSTKPRKSACLESLIHFVSWGVFFEESQAIFPMCLAVGVQASDLNWEHLVGLKSWPTRDDASTQLSVVCGKRSWNLGRLALPRGI